MPTHSQAPGQLHANDRAIELAARLVREQEARMTRFRPDSAARQTAERLLDALRDSLAVVQRCRRLADKSGPAFEPRSRLTEAAREEERRRIAQELHDDLGQQLSVLELSVHRVERLANAADCEPLGAAIRELHVQIDSSLDSVKRLTRQLRPVALETLGFSGAVEWLAAEFSHRSGVRIACRMRLNGLEMGEPAATSVFRIVQEALTNVARHASANTVTIDCFRDGERCVLRIADDGIGATIGGRHQMHSMGMGLSGIAERVAQMRGTFSIHSARGAGFSIVARLPISALAASDK